MLAFANHVAQALRHRHSSIFTMDSAPQTLQKTVSSTALVAGFSFSTFPRPQAGQINHPFFAVSLTDFDAFFKGLPPLSIKKYKTSSHRLSIED